MTVRARHPQLLARALAPRIPLCASPRPVARSLPQLAACALLIAALTAPAATAEERNLKLIYDFVVDANGVTDRGWRIFARPEQRNKLLLISPPGDEYLLVSVSDKSVRPVDRSLTKMNPNGTLDVLAGAVSGTRIIPLDRSGAFTSFSLDGRTITFKPRPPLLGPHTVNDLVSDRPPFGEGIQKYEPEAAAVSFLRSYGKPTEIEVFFGSWCPVCEAWVPKFLKSVQQAGNSNIQYQLIGLARDYQEASRAKGIRGLPTFIIRQGGIEVGRIVGAPDKGTVEGALADVLKAKS